MAVEKKHKETEMSPTAATSTFSSSVARSRSSWLSCKWVTLMALLLLVILLCQLYQVHFLRRRFDHFESHGAKDDASLLDARFSRCIKNHIDKIRSIGESDVAFEKTRSQTREYIRNYLVEKFDFSMEQIIWNKFEFQRQHAEGRQIVTTRWTGLNIVIWTNSTPIADEKVRVVAAHYDTAVWGLNHTLGVYDNLSGTGTVVELAGATMQYLKKQELQDRIPFLFVLLDHNKAPPTSLGSKSIMEHYGWTQNEVAFAIVVDSLGLRGTYPVLQTVGYEHDEHTTYTPRWLAQLMLLSSASVIQRWNGQIVHNLAIGHKNMVKSFLYQITRYHLISSRYLNDDGPFAWNGIPSTLFTNSIDYIYSENVIADNAELSADDLDDDLLAFESSMLFKFLLSTTDASISQFLQFTTSPTIANTGGRLLSHLFRFTDYVNQLLRYLYRNSYDQYVMLGPQFSFGFFDVIALSLVIMTVLYHNTFKSVRQLVKQAQQSQHYIVKTHRIFFFHLLLMTVALFMDSINASVYILAGSLALFLVPVTVYHIGIISSFICGIIALQFVFLDIIKIKHYGMRVDVWREFKLGSLITIYISHCVFVLLYGFDYYLKENRVGRDRFKHKKERHRD